MATDLAASLNSLANSMRDLLDSAKAMNAERVQLHRRVVTIFPDDEALFVAEQKRRDDRPEV